MSFGGQSNTAWQRNTMPFQNIEPQQMHGRQSNFGEMQSGGEMYGNTTGKVFVSYPHTYNSIGKITNINSDCGLVNDEVFFNRSVCKDVLLKLGDRVLFEATMSKIGQFKWNATRIQLITRQSTTLSGGDHMSSNCYSNSAASDFSFSHHSPIRDLSFRAEHRDREPEEEKLWYSRIREVPAKTVEHDQELCRKDFVYSCKPECQERIVQNQPSNVRLDRDLSNERKEREHVREREREPKVHGVAAHAFIGWNNIRNTDRQILNPIRRGQKKGKGSKVKTFGLAGQGPVNLQASSVPKDKRTQCVDSRPKQVENRTRVGTGAVLAATETTPRTFTSADQASGDSLTVGEVRRKTGLSGAGAKWYLRFLKEGLTTDEAMKRVLERAKDSPEGRKRATIEISLPDGYGAKRLKVSGSPNTMGNPTTKVPEASKPVRMAVLPKLYPAEILTREEQGQIVELLVEEMHKGWKSKLRFEGIHFRPGLILVDCCNEEVAEWLSSTFLRLSGWKGVKLSTCKEDDLPSTHMITMYLPRAAGVDTEKLLHLIDAQNEGQYTHLWRVFKSKDLKNGKLLTLGVDDRSLDAIKANDCTLNYRFGQIRVHVHERRKERLGTANFSPEKYIPAKVTETVLEEAARSGKAEKIDVPFHESEDMEFLDLTMPQSASEDDSNPLEVDETLTWVQNE